MLPPSVGQRYVLVVEDDPALRELYRSALNQAGFAVVAVEDGMNALSLVEAASLPAVVVLDLQLPRLSGHDLQQELRAHPATEHIPIVVVTGTDVRDLDPDQFACILSKPITPDLLVNAVRDCLRAAVGHRRS